MSFWCSSPFWFHHLMVLFFRTSASSVIIYLLAFLLWRLPYGLQRLARSVIPHQAHSISNTSLYLVHPSRRPLYAYQGLKQSSETVPRQPLIRRVRSITIPPPSYTSALIISLPNTKLNPLIASMKIDRAGK